MPCLRRKYLRTPAALGGGDLQTSALWNLESCALQHPALRLFKSKGAGGRGGQGKVVSLGPIVDGLRWPERQLGRQLPHVLSKLAQDDTLPFTCAQNFGVLLLLRLDLHTAWQCYGHTYYL